MRAILTALLTLSLIPAFAADPANDAPTKRGKAKAAVLERFDANHDGKLDDAERATARQAAHEKMKEKHPERFAAIDTDHDGALSKEEVAAGREHRRAERMAKLKEKHPEQFAAMDADHDGTVTRDEAKAWRKANPKAEPKAERTEKPSKKAKKPAGE
jgi:Ca2+-binding EF-hand superfamily protein